jgi:hypothetical protein
MAKRKLFKKKHLHLAAHQAVVELCLMHELKKPLTDACKIIEHEKSIFKLIWQCKVEPPDESEKLDGRLAFPDKEARDTLFFVFEQVGSNSEPPSSTEVAEETEAVDKDNGGDIYNAAIPHSTPFFGCSEAQDMGFLSISLDDSVIKFAVCRPLTT